jgi:cell division protein FtsB
MKRNYVLIFMLFVIILSYGLFYVANLGLENKISNLRTEYNSIEVENEMLKNSLLYYESPARIENIAKSKYKMVTPNDFYIVEMKNEE